MGLLLIVFLFIHTPQFLLKTALHTCSRQPTWSVNLCQPLLKLPQPVPTIQEALKCAQEYRQRMCHNHGIDFKTRQLINCTLKSEPMRRAHHKEYLAQILPALVQELEAGSLETTELMEEENPDSIIITQIMYTLYEQKCESHFLLALHDFLIRFENMIIGFVFFALMTLTLWTRGPFALLGFCWLFAFLLMEYALDSSFFLPLISVARRFVGVLLVLGSYRSFWDIYTRTRLVYKHLYKMVPNHSEDVCPLDDDVRPDLVNKGELKHANPLYYTAHYGVRITMKVPTSNLFFDNDREFNFGTVCQKSFVVSVEMLSQLNCPAVLSIGQTDEHAWLRINNALKNIVTVNQDRYDFMDGNHTTSNVALLGYALHRQLQHRSRQMDFFRPLQQ